MTVEDHPQVLMCLHLGLLLEETYIASQVLHILTVSGYTIIKTTGDTLWDDDNNFCAGVSGCMSLVFTLHTLLLLLHSRRVSVMC